MGATLEGFALGILPGEVLDLELLGPAAPDDRARTIERMERAKGDETAQQRHPGRVEAIEAAEDGLLQAAILQRLRHQPPGDFIDQGVALALFDLRFLRHLILPRSHPIAGDSAF